MTPRQVRNAGIMSLIGMALVLVAHFVRPELGASHLWLVFIFGVLPNFGAAFSLPFVMTVFAARFLRIEPGSGRLLKCFILSLSAAFLGLLAWEAIQALIWKYPFDPNDIAATGLGAAFSIGAYLLFISNFPPKVLRL